MIVVDRAKLKFLLAGREIAVDVSRQYRRGSVYALGVKANKATCYVQVVRCEPLERGWRVTVKQMSGDVVRLFTRGGNYVSAPVEVNPDDPDVLRGADFHEPEPLSEEQLRVLAQYRPANYHAAQQAPILELRDRIMADLDEALRTAPSRADRDKLRTMRHHASKLGS